MSGLRTVLFHPLNHIGLGHINRLSVIALALREIDKNIRTPFVVEEGAHVLLDILGLPYVPLPSSHTMKDSAVWAAWTASERFALQIQISRSVLRNLSPQVLVFDCWPNPAFAAAVVERKVPIVLCVREMRDLASYLAHVRGLLHHVRLIVIPHPEGAISLPEDLAAKSCFVGQITRQAAPMAISAHDPATPRIVISGGGGGYPRTAEFYNLAMQAITGLRERYPALKAQLIAGPLFRDWLLLQPVDGLTLIPFEPDTNSKFAEADLVICQAGYNTVAELEQLGTKTVLVPAERQWDDQFARAERISREHRNFRVFRGKTAAELAEQATELLCQHIPNSIAVGANGGIKAAQLIYEMLG
jgi:predicted glycosyltransferase